MTGTKRNTHGRPSLRASINAKCKSCIFDPEAKGNWRQQVSLCSVYSCPLWAVRPLSRASIPESVLEYYEVQPDDPCLGDRNEPQNNGKTDAGTPEKAETDSSTQGVVTVSQSSSELSYGGSPK